MTRTAISLCCFFLILASSFAQESPPILPGYIGLEDLDLFEEVDKTMEVEIGESMIGLVATNAENENPDFARVLRKLKRIRSYSFDLSAQERNKIDAYSEQLNSKLITEAWEIVYRLREAEGSANIYMKTVDGKAAGMTIVSIDENDQINVVNIIGDISLEDISHLAERFGFPDIAPQNQ
jgi:hypothetical protein